MIFTTRAEGTGYYKDVGVGGVQAPPPAALLLDKALRLDSPELRRASIGGYLPPAKPASGGELFERDAAPRPSRSAVI